MKQSIALGIVFGTLVVGGCCTSHRAKAWDYKVIQGSIGLQSVLPPLQQQLDQAAADGWQVVSSSCEDSIGQNVMVILKRPK